VADRERWRLRIGVVLMSFARVQTVNREINQLQSNIATVLNPLLEQPFANGKFIQSISLVSGNNRIIHNLGRTVLGWMLTNVNGPAQVYLVSSNETTITLNSNSSVTVTLFVF